MNLKPKKIAASALVYSLLVSIVILILASGIIAYQFYGKMPFIKLKQIHRVNDNIESAISYLLRTTNLKNGDSISIDLFQDQKDFAGIKCEYWGVLPMYKVTSKGSNYEIYKRCMRGHPLSSSFSVALTQTDKPLNIGGSSFFEGNVYFPNGMFKRLYLGSGGNSRTEFVENKILNSHEFQLPNWIHEFQTSSKDFLEKYKNYKSVSFEQLLTLTDSIINENVLYSHSGFLRLTNLKISGSVIISCADSIYIDNGCNLNGVILIAPVIIFGEGFKGNIQCFATKRIITSKRCVFYYPSVFTLNSPNLIQENQIIELGENSRFSGIIFNKTTINYPYTHLIHLKEKAIVYGKIFSSENMQLDGKVYGQVISGKAFLKTSSSVYENALFNAEVRLNGVDQCYFDWSLNVHAKDKIVWYGY